MYRWRGQGRRKEGKAVEGGRSGAGGEGDRVGGRRERRGPSPGREEGEGRGREGGREGWREGGTRMEGKRKRLDSGAGARGGLCRSGPPVAAQVHCTATGPLVPGFPSGYTGTVTRL